MNRQGTTPTFQANPWGQKIGVTSEARQQGWRNEGISRMDTDSCKKGSSQIRKV